MYICVFETVARSFQYAVSCEMPTIKFSRAAQAMREYMDMDIMNGWMMLTTFSIDSSLWAKLTFIDIDVNRSETENGMFHMLLRYTH